ncbi:MAG: hypothetical protein AAFO84_02750 [Cyanobacteria bacterium J06598_1]
MEALIGIILFAVYGTGVWKFWSGFNRTNFTSKKLSLTLLWPVFLIANKDYRKNFTKAIKGS